MTEIQKARSVVKIPAGEVRKAARRAHRANRRTVRRALAAGDWTAADARPRSIAWELS